MLLMVSTMVALFAFKADALSLSYSGSSTSNTTGAGATTSGFAVSYTDSASNICGYRFSIVSSNGLPKSGTKVLNVYKTDITIGSTAYSSGQRFIVSSGVAANKKQLANGTKVSSSTTTQGCDCYSTAAGFFSTIPQAPGSIGDWFFLEENAVVLHFADFFFKNLISFFWTNLLTTLTQKLLLGWKDIFNNMKEQLLQLPTIDTFWIMLPVGFWNLIVDKAFLTRVTILHGLNRNKSVLNKKPEKKLLAKRFWLMNWSGFKKILKLAKQNQKHVSMLMMNCWLNLLKIRLQPPIFIFR